MRSCKLNRKPLSDWDNPFYVAPGVIYSTQLDGRYILEVVRIDQNYGRLLLWDHQKDDACIMDNEVPLAYGAVFGPDAEDVMKWQDRCAAFVDSLKGEGNG